MGVDVWSNLACECDLYLIAQKKTTKKKSGKKAIIAHEFSTLWLDISVHCNTKLNDANLSFPQNFINN